MLLNPSLDKEWKVSLLPVLARVPFRIPWYIHSQAFCMQAGLIHPTA
jgi:hypothetical protein